MKTKEILEQLQKTAEDYPHDIFLIWAQQLARDLRIAIKALQDVTYGGGLPWEIAKEALREIDL
jgi:hypothetical protein